MRIQGAWLGGGEGGACSLTVDALACPAGPSATVSARLTLGGDLVASVEVSADATVEGVALEGEATVPGATSWLSNGLQSWSQSGMVALGEAVTEVALASALAAQGDDETLRSGTALSWWYTVVGGGDAALVAGAVTAETLRPWIQVFRDPGGALALRLVSGASGEAVAVPAGGTLAGETWRVQAGGEPTRLLSAYAADLPSRRAARPAPPEAGWNSWYEIWDDVDATAVSGNAALARDLLDPVLPAGESLRIVVDDGWQRAWGDWEPNPKLPAGLDGLVSELAGQGFRTGVWLAPLLVHEDVALVAEHPDWFLPDVSYRHLTNGRMRILDVTHPDAAAHLGAAIARIVSWGLDFLKIDFLFAGAYESRRHEAMTGLQAYRRALALIREAAGEDVILLAVGAPPLPSFPYVDAWRLGGDIALEPLGLSWYFTVNQARSLGVRWPLCLATLCDPDPILMRELVRDEVVFGAWLVALAGAGLWLSDDLRILEAERPGWALTPEVVGAAFAGAPAVPEDLFPADPPADLTNAALDLFGDENRHVLPLRWRLADGSRVLLNASDTPLTVGGVTVPPRGAARLP